MISFNHPLVPTRVVLITLCCLTLLCQPTDSYAQLSSETYATVINLAGKQRMLTQKMSKEAVLVALNIDAAANATSLSNTVSLFNKTLSGLKTGDYKLGLPATTDQRILKQLNRVSQLWAELKPTFDAIIRNQSATQEQISLIAEKNLPLLKNMNRAVLMYEKSAENIASNSNNQMAAAINLAGKQRMLTQKMSKEVLLVAYQYQIDDNQLHLLDTVSLFDRTLIGLKAGDDILGLSGTQDTNILEQLAVVEQLWSEFKALVEPITKVSTIDDARIQAIAAQNLPLLKEMNKAVQLFESASR